MLATEKMHRNAKQIADCNFMMLDDGMIDSTSRRNADRFTDFDARTVARGEFSRILYRLLFMNITSTEVSRLRRKQSLSWRYFARRSVYKRMLYVNKYKLNTVHDVFLRF